MLVRRGVTGVDGDSFFSLFASHNADVQKNLMRCSAM
jgi:hypothetical protein